MIGRVIGALVAFGGLGLAAGAWQTIISDYPVVGGLLMLLAVAAIGWGVRGLRDRVEEEE